MHSYLRDGCDKVYLLPNTIEVAFTPTRWDLLRAGQMGLRARPVFFFFSLSFFVILPWLIALAFLLAYFAGVHISLFPMVVLLFIPPVAVVFFSLIPLWVARGARSLRGTHHYAFSEGEIRLVGPGFENRVEWPLITRCFGFKSGLLFVSGNAPLITVPGRALPSVASAQLRQLLISKNVELCGAMEG